MNSRRQALAAALSLSAAGISFLQQHEGLVQLVYPDPVGIPTVCWGHMDPALKAGTRYSKARCEALLKMDTMSAHKALADLVKVPLSQNQYDALVSLVFNIGRDAFSRSTLLRKLNDGDYDGAAEEFPRWSYAGGRKIQGLLSRRIDEQALFIKE